MTKRLTIAAVMARVEDRFGLDAIKKWVLARETSDQSSTEPNFRNDLSCLLELRGAVDETRIREQISIKNACRWLVDRSFAIQSHEGPADQIENGECFPKNDEIQISTWSFISADYLEAEYKRAKKLLAERCPATFEHHLGAIKQLEVNLGLERKKRGRPKK